MTARVTTWAAALLWLISGAGFVAIYGIETARDGWSSQVADLGWALILVTPTVGAVVAIHRPRNPIGWLIGVFSVTLIGTFLASTIYPPGSSSVPIAGRWLVWVTEIMTPAMLLAMCTLLLLFFPTGRVPSPRWRPVTWLTIALILGIAARKAFGSEQLWTDPVVMNPAYAARVGTVLQSVEVLGLILVPAVILASLVSLVMRFTHARGVERRQLEWFTYAVGLEVAALLLTIISSEIAWGGQDLIYGVLGFYAIWIGMPIVIPLVVGIAILRHNLFDIERLIHRTLVYGALTLSLGSVYVLLVLAPAIIVGSGGSMPDVVIAAATLVVAALIRPLRGHIQRIVDRRFYRHRYDAVRTVERFSTQMRDIVELPALESALVATAAESMQPAHVSLWLRPPPAR
ncbi:MAG TPA: hypothetical protein VMM78_06470 [Thermomicrobiales bacterium]|nr:hypothetical protein [Thermomicrobiales bacterium]